VMIKVIAMIKMMGQCGKWLGRGLVGAGAIHGKVDPMSHCASSTQLRRRQGIASSLTWAQSIAYQGVDPAAGGWHA